MNAREIFEIFFAYGLPPMQAPSVTAPIEWNGFLIDWGVCGERGYPEPTAHLRGIIRLAPGTDPLLRQCDGPYIAASDLREAA